MKIQKNKISLFAKNESGVVWIMVAILLPVLFAVMFLVLDTSRTQAAYADNQGAVDATALAVAEEVLTLKILENKTGNIEDFKKSAMLIYKSNLQLNKGSFEIDSFDLTMGAGEIKIKACVVTKNKFNDTGSIENAETSKACNEATANIPQVSNVEIALALDITPSMLAPVNLGGTSMTKIEALKRALIGDGTNGGLLNSDLAKQAEASKSVYWSVIPFRGMVDVGNNWQNVVANDWGDKNYPNAMYKTPHAAMGGKDEILQSEQKEYEVLARLRVNNDCEASGPNPSECGIEAFNNSTSAFPQNVPGWHGHDIQRSHIYWPPTHAKALKSYYHDNAQELLGRVPLTERASGDDSLSLDARPEGANKFKAYWHHPRKYWFHFEGYNNVGIYGGNAHYCFSNYYCPGGGTPTPPSGGGNGGT